MKRNLPFNVGHTVATLALLALSALVIASPARAESVAGSASDSLAVVAPQNIGNPIINIDQKSPGEIRTKIDSNQAATPATVFVNPPSNDTCSKAGDGASVQFAGFGGAVSNGGEPSETCETRADTINLKVTGANQSVIKARQCQSPAMAQAYEDAGDPCVQRLRPARAQEQARAQAALNGQTVPASSASNDPYIARSGRQWPSLSAGR